MAVDLAIKNARVVNPWGTFTGGIAVGNGKIVAVGSDATLPSADRVIDAGNLHVLPGVIDPHTHLNQGPEQPDLQAAEKRAWTTETRSAAVGGVTTLMTFLYRAESYLDIFAETKKLCDERAYVDVVFHGTILRDRHVEQIPDCAQKVGITSFKWLMPYRQREAASIGLPGENGVDDGVLYLGLLNVAKVGYPALAMIHTENVEIFWKLSQMLKAAGRFDLDAWWEARPRVAEEEYLLRSIYFSELTGARIYIVHMSIGSGARIVSEARARGVQVFAETCSHYLNLTREDVKKFGKLAKLNPPLRDKEDVELLWQGIFDGSVDCVGTDHCALTKEQKDRTGDIWTCTPGFPGVATLLPVMLHEGVHKRGLTIERVTELLSYNPARIFGIHPRKGAIEVGADADLTFVDLKREMKVTPELLMSHSDYTLYDGWVFRGWPVKTLVRGTIVMEDGKIVAKPGTGRYVPRELPARHTP